MPRKKKQDRYFTNGRFVTEQEFMGILWIENHLRVLPALPAPKTVLMLPATIHPLPSPPHSVGRELADETLKVLSMPKVSRVGYRVNVPGWGRGVIVSDKTWDGATLYQVQGDYGVVWRRWENVQPLDAGQAVVIGKAA